MTPDDRRASIIAATIPLLRDKGRTVSTKEIAKASGIAEGTIFRVFASKDEIVLACVHEAFDTSALLDELARVDRGLDLRDRLAQAVTVMQDHLKGIFALMAVLQSTGQPLHRPSGADATHRRREATAELDAAFQDLIGPDADRLRIPAADLHRLPADAHPLERAPDARRPGLHGPRARRRHPPGRSAAARPTNQPDRRARTTAPRRTDRAARRGKN